MYFKLFLKCKSINQNLFHMPSGPFEIMVIGGLGENNVMLSNVEVINPFGDSIGPPKPNELPGPQYGMITMQFNNTYIICGGRDINHNNLKRCYEYQSNKWKVAGYQLLHARAFAASISIDNYTFWITGSIENDQAINSSELFHVKNKTFTEGVSLPVPMGQHCKTGINSSHLLIVGNNYLQTWAHMAYIVNISSHPFIFKPLPDLIHPRGVAACATIKQPPHYSNEDAYFIVAGGVGCHMTGCEATSTTEMLRPYTARWESGPRLREVYGGGIFINRENKMYLVGGFIKDINARPQDYIMVIDHTTNETQILKKKLSIAREFMVAIIIESMCWKPT